MAHLGIRLLGTFQVSLDSQPLTGFESNKVRALLAFLLVENDQDHLRQKLAALLWPEMPSRRANYNLNQALYNLRKVIQDHQADPPYLLRTQESIHFNPNSDYWLDVAALQSELGQSFTRDQSALLEKQDIARLKDALELYRGDFLGGLSLDDSPAFDEWRLVVQQRLQQQVLKSFYQLTEAFAERGEIPQALSYAQRQVEIDPLCEPAHRQLMRLLAESGQRAQALAQFKRLQVVLAEELKISPETQTLALRDQIRDRDQITTRRAKPRDNLPAFLTPLVGRVQELAELKEILSQPGCRLLTVLGPGGSGKTRLALEVARTMREAFLDGVFLVALNPLQSPESILPAIAEALDLPRPAGDDQQTLLVNYLQARRLLLVLDGFEHLLVGAQGVAALLQHAPDLAILVTSRTRLNIKGEHLYPLAGLRFPLEGASPVEIQQSDAVQLLIDALRRSQPDFQPTTDDLVHLRQVCQQVLGMPLGLLLAASWGGSLELAEIAEKVSQDLDYLAAEWAEVPARQRSMRATFDHTWRLLTERQQALFQGLSVFRGAFSRRAARMVCQASPHELRQLVERSLLWHKTPGWYEVHELLRQYGRQRLAQVNPLEQSICEQHSRYYLEQLARLQVHLKSAGQEAALESIDLEHENYRAAWDWAAGQGDAAQLAAALEPLCLYYDLRLRYSEGESACNSAIEGLSNDKSNLVEYLLRVRLMIWGGRFIRLQGRYEQAEQQRKTCQSLLKGIRKAGSDICYEQALLCYEWGESRRRKDLQNAQDDFLQSLALFQELGHPWWRDKAMLGKIKTNILSGNFEAAQSSLTQCQSSLADGADRRNLAQALSWQAFIHVRQGKTEPAMQNMQESAAVYRSIGDQPAIAESLSGLGLLLAWNGQFQKSLESLHQSLSIQQELGGSHHTTFTKLVIGMVHAFLGSYSEAESWCLESLSQAKKFGFRRDEAASLLVLGWVALSQSDFQRAESLLQESVSEYRKVNHQDELGWALAALGHAKLVQGKTCDGLGNVCESLKIGREIRANMTICQVLGPSALWIAEPDDPALAVELYSLACQHPGLAKACWFEDIYGRPITARAERLPTEVLEAAKERGRARDLWQTADQLLEELSRVLENPLSETFSP